MAEVDVVAAAAGNDNDDDDVGATKGKLLNNLGKKSEREMDEHDLRALKQ